MRKLAGFNPWQVVLLCALFCNGSLLTSAHAQHAGDVLMGRSAASQLVAMNLTEQTIRLPFISSGNNVGWASTSLGFDRVITPDPSADLLPMTGNGEIHLEIVEIEAGLSFRAFSAFNSVIADVPGETLRLGTANSLHYHPIVLIDASSTGQEFQGTRRAVVRFVDLSGVHSPSAPHVLTFAPPPAMKRTYALRLLDVHDALNSSAEAISDTGLICGTWSHQDTSAPGGVIHNAVELQHLVPPPPGYPHLKMTGINRTGDTVGSTGSDGFLLKSGTYTILTPPGTSGNQPRALNDAGQIVGSATSSGGTIAWFREASGSYITLSGLPGYTGHGATGINNLGHIIGYSTRPGPGGIGVETASWSATSGNVQPVQFVGTTGFNVLAVNDAAEILISYRRAATGDLLRHAIRQGTSWSELFLTPLPGMSDYRVTSMNNHGEITGTCFDSGGRQHGFRGRPTWLPAIENQTASLAPVWSGSQLKLTLPVLETATVHEPGASTIHAGPAARHPVPDHPDWSFMGAPGSAVWVLPSGPTPNLTRLDVAPNPVPGVFVNDLIHLDLEKADGPGHLLVFRTDAAGHPFLLMDSRDGISAADRITIPATPAPEPTTWAFTAPGSWRITLRLRGLLSSNGTETVSAPQTIYFFLEPGNLFPSSLELTRLGSASSNLIVAGETGRECVLRSSTDLQQWQTVQRFHSTSPSTIIPVDLTGPRQFFQATFR